MVNVAIIGLGYVGLPLAIESAKSGHSTIGLDIDSNRINNLNLGVSYLEDIDSAFLKEQILFGNFRASQDFSEIKKSEIIIICVPTPLLDNHKPDLSAVENVAKLIATHLTQGQLIILESTVEPETTRKFLVPLLETYSGLKRELFDIAFSPERIDPTNKKWRIGNTPKIVAGLTERASTRAFDFYSKFIENVIVVESLEIAEAAKLLENSFRFVNISFVNEFSIFCQKLGIDVIAVINAAATKPYGFMPFYPGLGAGGHCIPIDPMYLANKSREVGAPTRFIDLADELNQEMPRYFVTRAEEMLGGLKSKKVLVVGVSYKPNVADVRETPVEALISGLKQKGAKVFWHDDLVKEWNGENSAALSNQYDLAILATPHDYLDLKRLGDIPILDTRRSV